MDQEIRSKEKVLCLANDTFLIAIKKILKEHSKVVEC
jgi:hypothetical protein